MKKEYNKTIVGRLDRQEETRSIRLMKNSSLIVVYQEMMNFRERVIPLPIKKRC